jgi:enoyl-CoA hydratase/carnithine racemase
MERTEQQSLPLLLREDRGAVSILTLNRPEKLNALAAEKSSFSKAEINIGIIPTFGGTQRLPRNVGRKAAIELILTGRIFDATEAARLGLINRVVPGFDLLEEAVKLAEALATKPPLTLAAVLAAIHRGMDASIDDGLAIEEAAFASIVRPMMLGRVWRHSWRNVARHSSADNAV